MQKEIITELEDLRDETEFIINNQEIVENKHVENYLRSLERIRYNLFKKIELKNKYEINEQIKVVIKEISEENKTIKISVKDLLEDPFKNIRKDFTEKGNYRLYRQWNIC